MKKLGNLLFVVVTLFCLMHTFGVMKYHSFNYLPLAMLLILPASVAIMYVSLFGPGSPKEVKMSGWRWLVGLSFASSLVVVGFLSAVTVPKGSVLIYRGKIYYPESRIFLMPIKDWTREDIRVEQTVFGSTQWVIPQNTNGYVMYVGVKVKYDFAKAQENNASSQDWPNIPEDIRLRFESSEKPFGNLSQLLDREFKIDGKIPATWAVVSLDIHKPRPITF